jgi:hypothetical protein
MDNLKLILLLSLLVFSFSPFKCIAQFDMEKGLKGDSCEFYLSIDPGGRFYYTKSTRPAINTRPKSERPIISIKNGDTLRLSSSDIIWIETLSEGKWYLKNDTLVLSDRISLRENNDWKTYYLVMIDKYTFLNINLPECATKSILYTTYIKDSKNNWTFNGKIKDGRISGKTYIDDKKGNKVLCKKFDNVFFFEKELFEK